MDERIEEEMTDRMNYALNKVEEDSLYFAHPIDIYGTVSGKVTN